MRLCNSTSASDGVMADELGAEVAVSVPHRRLGTEGGEWHMAPFHLSISVPNESMFEVVLTV